MSVLGDRYKYDVFFSYAWGTTTGNQHLRNWTRAVIDATLVLLGQRYDSSGGSFNDYLDRDETRTAQDLDAELRQAAEGSGVFVAFVSPFYNAPYCQKEVQWFCERLHQKGDSLANRVCLIRIQETPHEIWPLQFKGDTGKPLIYMDLCDEHGQPRSMAGYVLEGKLSGLADQVERLALEIVDKITKLERSERDREEFRRTQVPPDRPLYFLEAEPTDEPSWTTYSKEIEGVPSIVLPAGKPKPATAIASDDDLKTFNGIIMLRSRCDDDFSSRIQSAYFYRRELFLKSKPWIPWVLLDEVDPAPPEQAKYHIPRVKLKEGDWLENLKQAMRC